MENDKDYSLDRSVEVEKIIDFYKNIEESDETPQSDITDNNNKFALTLKKIKNGFHLLLQKTPLYTKHSTKADTDNEIESHSFGLSGQGKIVLYHTVSFLVSIAIIVISVVLTIFLPGNKIKISEKEAELRNKEDYVSLYSRHSAIKSEIEDLTLLNEEKNKILNEVSDSDNTKSELRLQIDTKKQELNNLNTQISSKKNIIAELDKTIAAKAPAEKVYTPGKYIVGTHLAAGKYTVTGTGKFMVATASGKSKINATLSSTPLEIELQETDVIKLGGKVKFTSNY